MAGPTILGRCFLGKTMEQGRRSGDVLACPNKARKGFIIGDDPSVHVVGHGACASTVSVALDLPIELRTFLLELESRFIKLSMLGFQLLHPYMRWGRYLHLVIIVEVVRRGSPLLGDTFDVSLGVPITKHSRKG